MRFQRFAHRDRGRPDPGHGMGGAADRGRGPEGKSRGLVSPARRRTPHPDGFRSRDTRQVFQRALAQCCGRGGGPERTDGRVLPTHSGRILGVNSASFPRGGRGRSPGWLAATDVRGLGKRRDDGNGEARRYPGRRQRFRIELFVGSAGEPRSRSGGRRGLRGRSRQALHRRSRVEDRGSPGSASPASCRSRTRGRGRSSPQSSRA